MTNKKRKATSAANVFPIFQKKVKLDATNGSTSLNDASGSSAPEITLQEFERLLDLSSLETEDEIDTRLEKISKALIHNFRMAVRREGEGLIEFDIVEAEFYLQIEKIHEDPFTHGSDEQRFSGSWYFHRAPQFSADSRRSATSSTMYRDGSRKGMDLTFGGPAYASPKAIATRIWSDVPESTEEVTPPPRLLRGGILLRSIRQVGTRNHLTSGPSLLVDQILSACGASTITDLVQQKWQGDISAFYPDETKMPHTCLFIKAKTSPSNPTQRPVIYRSPRIGLELSHPGTTPPIVRPLHPRIMFLPKRYRFFISPSSLTANGRPQTFLGVLRAIIESYTTEVSGLKKANLSREISSLTGTKDATAAKYLAGYVAGREGGAEVLAGCIGSKGKGIGSSPGSYLKMLGSISKVLEEDVGNNDHSDGPLLYSWITYFVIESLTDASASGEHRRVWVDHVILINALKTLSALNLNFHSKTTTYVSTMENPHAERQAVLLERIVKNSTKCTEMILELNHCMEEIIRANQTVKIAADLATKYRKNVQYNLEATKGN